MRLLSFNNSVQRTLICYDDLLDRRSVELENNRKLVISAGVDTIAIIASAERISSGANVVFSECFRE